MRTSAPTIGATFLYVDPRTDAPITSQTDYNVHLGAFTRQMPGAAATVVSLSEHHGHARATVEFSAGGKAMMRGQYFADLDGDGRILRLVGFTGTGDT